MEVILLPVTDEKKRVLLAVSNPQEVTQLRNLLEFSYGDKIQCLRSIDGVEATSKVQYQTFQCIVLDLNLPKKSGNAVVSSIRNSHLNVNTPIVILKNEDSPREGENFPNVYFFDRPIDGGHFLRLASETMGLGTGDQRLCASLVNFVTYGIQEFFFTTGLRKMKVIGPNIGPVFFAEGSFSMKIILESSQSRIQLLISIPSEIIIGLRDNLQFLKSVKDQRVAHSLVLFTFQRALKNFSETFKLKPEIVVAPQSAISKAASTDVVSIDLVDTDGSKVQVVVLSG